MYIYVYKSIYFLAMSMKGACGSKMSEFRRPNLTAFRS